jgi:hypothetical protein
MGTPPNASSAFLFEVLIGQIRQDECASVVLGKALCVLPETELLEPVSDLLHRGSAPDYRASPQRGMAWALFSGRLLTRIRVLAKIATSPRSSPSAAVAACIALLDRGWGKPTTDNKHRPDRQRHGHLERPAGDIAAKRRPVAIARSPSYMRLEDGRSC